MIRMLRMLLGLPVLYLGILLLGRENFVALVDAAAADKEFPLILEQLRQKAGQ